MTYTRRETFRALGVLTGLAVVNGSGLEAIMGCGSNAANKQDAVPAAPAQPRTLEKNDPTYGSASRPPHFAGAYVINGDAVDEMRNLAGLLMYNEGKSKKAPRIEQSVEGPYLGIEFSEETPEGTHYLIKACERADSDGNFIITKTEAQTALEPAKKPIYDMLQQQKT